MTLTLQSTALAIALQAAVLETAEPIPSLSTIPILATLVTVVTVDQVLLQEQHQ